jgi:hypothetical protein
MRPRPPRPRFPGWEELLAELVDARRATPFTWGTQDCCAFAADVVLTLTGVDPMAGFRGRYADEAAAEALIGPDGLEAQAAAAMAGIGAPEVPAAFAQRGDVALVLVGNQPTIGVVLGHQVAAPGPDGLAFVPARLIQRAWAV